MVGAQKFVTNPWGDKGDLISSQLSTVYYSQGDQALYQQTDVHLTGYHWEKVTSFENHDKTNPIDTSVTTTLGTTVTSGEEFSTSFQMGGGANATLGSLGFSFSTNHGEEHKTFTQTESSTTVSREQHFTVQPGSNVYY